MIRKKTSSGHGGAVRNILLIRYGLIGDTLLSLPFVRWIKADHPEAAVTVVIDPIMSGLCAGCLPGDRLIPFDRRHCGFMRFWRFTVELRRTKADLAIVFNASFQAALMAWMAGAKKRIGFKREGRSFLLTNPVKEPDYNIPFTEQCKILVEQAGIPVGEIEPPRLTANTEAAEYVQSKLAEFGLDLHAHPTFPLVVIQPGAGHNFKIWPYRGFARVADFLIASENARVVLVGGKAEVKLGEYLLESMEHAEHCYNLIDLFNLVQLTELLRMVSLVLVNDTGVMHLAGILDRPIVALFMKNPKTWRPWGAKVTILQAENYDITTINVSAVIDACQSLLGSKNSYIPFTI